MSRTPKEKPPGAVKTGRSSNTFHIQTKMNATDFIAACARYAEIKKSEGADHAL